MFHVNPDLVGSSRMEVAHDESRFLSCPENLVIGNCVFAVRGIEHCHFLAIARISADVSFYRGGCRRGDSRCDSEVLFDDGPGSKLTREVLVGEVVARDDDAAAGILIEAVDDPGTLDPTDRRKTTEVVEEGVHQSA